MKIKDNTRALLRALESLTEREVLVGIPFANAPRTPDEAEARKADGTPLTNAELGYVHEFGVPEQNIPSRAFLVPGCEAAKERAGKALRAGAVRALKGDKNAGTQALTKAGLIAETAVKEKINEGPFVPLAPRTLRQRRARGRTGEKPLIDTGQLRNSITHVIREKE